MSRERPVLFSGAMVRAILAGTKTQTRRVIAPVQPREDGLWPAGRDPVPDCPFGRAGDTLWVRETWGPLAGGVTYRATANTESPDGNRWRPSIHMPRWASRLSLEIVSVRVERLQAITGEDAAAEGITIKLGAAPGTFAIPVSDPGFTQALPPGPLTTLTESAVARAWFASLWDSINGARSPWDANPWVWVVSFRRVEGA